MGKTLERAAGASHRPPSEGDAWSVPEIIIPEEVLETARRSIGDFFRTVNHADPEANVRDFLDTSKSLKRAEIFEKYTTLRNRKVLEVGSGFGTNLAMWIKHFHVDGYGVEPGSEGFDAGYCASLKVFEANGISAGRIVKSGGESLPFPDESFDLVYSANVLEHTQNPEQTLRESIRVLRPGGVLHMEMPNYLSYFEGHYLVLQAPIVWRPMLPWLLKWVYRRDPSFARTLQTQINPVWCRRTMREIGREYHVRVISCGEELFLERMARAFDFEMATVASRLRRTIKIVQAANRGNWIGRSIVALQGHYPIYLTAKKG